MSAPDSPFLQAYGLLDDTPSNYHLRNTTKNETKSEIEVHSKRREKLYTIYGLKIRGNSDSEHEEDSQEQTTDSCQDIAENAWNISNDFFTYVDGSLLSNLCDKMEHCNWISR